MENGQTAKARLRKKYLVLFLLVVVVWAAAGTACWSGRLKSVTGGSKIGLLVALPVGLTTWPAHEFLLVRSGEGFGRNTGSEFSLVAFLFFASWCAMLWSPLLFLLRGDLPRWIWISVQVLVLLIVSTLFWKFGNG